MSIQILIADDHKITRDGLRSLIENETNMQVVAEAGDGRTTIAQARKYKPHVIVMDISMPDLNGMEATREIVADFPDIKVLALSMHSHRKYVIGMFRAGVSGYLLKNCAFDELVSAINTIITDKTYISPSLVDTVMKDYKQLLRTDEIKSPLELTSREREVLQLVAEGFKTKDIASRLNVSQKTVEKHRQQIMDKLDIRSIAELTKYALQEGITSFDT